MVSSARDVCIILSRHVMSKDLTHQICHGLECCYQWLVPVMKGQLNRTKRKAKINSDECSLNSVCLKW